VLTRTRWQWHLPTSIINKFSRIVSGSANPHLPLHGQALIVHIRHLARIVDLILHSNMECQSARFPFLFLLWLGSDHHSISSSQMLGTPISPDAQKPSVHLTPLGVVPTKGYLITDSMTILRPVPLHVSHYAPIPFFS